LFGSFSAGQLANSIGRRYTAIIATGICLLGGSSPAFSVNLAMFLVLRFILGFGVGLIGVLCPLYVSEVVPSSRRGTYGVVFQLSLCFGILLSYIVGFVVIDKLNKTSIAWRLMLASGGIILPIILLFIIVIGMKETRDEQMIGEDRPINDMTQFRKRDYDGPTGWRGLFVRQIFLKQTLTGIILAITLQLTGVNAIIYFGTNILAQAFPGSNAILLNIGIGAWNFLATFISLYLVEKLSRRVLMTGATIVIAISLFIVALCFQFLSNDRDRGIGIGIGLLLFLGGFEAGPGCLFYILANEIFDKHVQAEGASLVNVLQWTFNLVVSTLFPLMFNSHLGPPGTFYVFGAFGVLCSLYLFFFLDLQK